MKLEYFSVPVNPFSIFVTGLASSPSPQRDCVVMSLRGSNTTEAISQSIEMRIRVWHSAGFASCFRTYVPSLVPSLNGRGWG
jgi:hypothetical protein